MESFVHVGYFADGVLESSYFYEFLKPGGNDFLEYTEEGLLGHAGRQFAKDETDVTVEFLLEFVLGDAIDLTSGTNRIFLLRSG